jgi:hypothetical protein
MVFSIVSRRLGERVRKAYFRALLANDATWHATQGTCTKSHLVGCLFVRNSRSFTTKLA